MALSWRKSVKVTLGFLWRTLWRPEVRVLVGGIVVVGAFAGAEWAHDYKPWVAVDCGLSEPCRTRRQPSWADPATIGLAIVGLGAMAVAVSAVVKRDDDE